MAQALNAEEIELRLIELVNREKRINAKEIEVEKYERALQERQAEIEAKAAGISNVERENAKELEKQLLYRDDLLRQQAEKELELRERLNFLQETISQNQRTNEENLKMRSFANSTLNQTQNSNPFVDDKNETFTIPNNNIDERNLGTKPRVKRVETFPPNGPYLQQPFSSQNNPAQNPGKSFQNHNSFTDELHFNFPTNAMIKEAIKAVPVFDGRNLFKFLKAIRKIRDQFPRAAEYELVSLLKFRISDSASTLIDDIVIYTVNDLVYNLKTIFAAHQSSNYYRGQLSNQSKLPRETMLEFIERFAETHAAIIDCTCLELNKEKLSESEYLKLDRDCMQEFLYALPPETRVLFNSNNYTNLSQLYAEAIRTERRIEIDRTRHQNNFNQNSNNNNNYDRNFNRGKFDNRRNFSDDVRNNERLSNRDGSRRERFCNYCNKKGHGRDYCFKKQKDEREAGNGNARNAAGRNPSGNLETRNVNLIEESPASSYLPSRQLD